MPINGTSICEVVCPESVCALLCIFVVFMPSVTFKKKSQGDISLNGGHKSVPPPCLCVYGEVDCLRDEGLSDKSRLVGLVFCSLYISSQLRDKADKSASPFPTSSSSYTPSCVLLSYLPLWCLLFMLSSLPLPFFHALLGLTFHLGSNLTVICTFKQNSAGCYIKVSNPKDILKYVNI